MEDIVILMLYDEQVPDYEFMRKSYEAMNEQVGKNSLKMLKSAISRQFINNEKPLIY